MLNRCSISVRLLKFVLQARVCTHGMLTEDSPQWIAVLHPFFHWFHHFTHHNLPHLSAFEIGMGTAPIESSTRTNIREYACFLSQGSIPIIHFCLGFSWIFHNKPTILGYPIDGNPHMFLTCFSWSGEHWHGEVPDGSCNFSKAPLVDEPTGGFIVWKDVEICLVLRGFTHYIL
jgi:hypothetical protein